jgi:hypothetical protein
MPANAFSNSFFKPEEAGKTLSETPDRYSNIHTASLVTGQTGGVYMRPSILVTLILAAIILAGALASPAAARGPSINDIQPGDTIFLYEQGLDLTGLRNPVTMSPVTSLNQYQDDDPAKALTGMVVVDDDTDFDVLPSLFGDEIARYYAYSQADGATTAAVFVVVPTVTITPVLANPYHNDVIEGISVPVGTAIAFRIESPFVGTAYQVGGVPGAKISILVTKPGGAQSTSFGGSNLADLPVGSVQFYTDDPGIAGPSVLSGLEPGSYSIVAEWSAPASFAAQAPDSNVISFAIGDKVGVDVTLTTPATTHPTAVMTTFPPTTAPPSTTATTVPTLPPETSPPASPTTSSPAAGITVIAAAFFVFLVVCRRR